MSSDVIRINESAHQHKACLYLATPPLLPAAFLFKLDAGSSHQNLKVEDLSVEWDSCGGKVIQDIRKDKNRTNQSPMHSPARSETLSAISFVHES